jgi:exodeoxyribonuclease VII large subunit
VIRDILRVLENRYPNLPVHIYPVRVQGAGADKEIIRAIEALNRWADHDIILLARGGGSLEDLAAFNSEALAYAIFESAIPVVSAVGHETDFTIADFVADLRASTPSVAAEMIAPRKIDLQARIAELRVRCIRNLRSGLQNSGKRVRRLQKSLVHPGKKIQDAQIHNDFLAMRLRKNMVDVVEKGYSRIARLTAELEHASPQHRIEKLEPQVNTLEYKLSNIINKISYRKNERLQRAVALLSALNPERILERGYSITRSIPGNAIVTRASQAQPGRHLQIQLARGRLEAVVSASREE